MRHSFIYIASLLLVVLGSCVKHDLEPDLAVRSGKVVRTFLETPATKADLALGSADGYTNPSPVVEALPMEKDSTVGSQDVKFPYRDEVYEREQATKVTIANNGSMAFSYGDKIAYCISNGSSTSYNVSTIDLTEGGFPESLPSGYSRCNYAIYPASARGTNYTAPTVVYADTYDLDDATDEETFSWAPMVGRNNGESVSFYHVGGVLRLKCTLIPAGAARIRVTFNGMSYVTGTYSVSNPGTTSASTALVSGSRNYVEFTKDSFGNKTTMNIPLPSGSYADCTGITVEVFNGSGTSLGSQTCSWWLKEVVRGSGLKLSLLLGEVAIYNAAQTLWKGNTFNYVGGVSGDGVTWSSSNTSVATVDQSGVVTAIGKGEADIILTVEEVGKSVSCKVYVNQVTGINIAGAAYPVAVGYSTVLEYGINVSINGGGKKYGSVPSVTYTLSSSNSNIVRVDGPKTLYGAGIGSATVTASIPANSYGVHSAFISSYTYNVNYLVTVDVVGSISSPSNAIFVGDGDLRTGYSTIDNYDALPHASVSSVTTSFVAYVTRNGTTWTCTSASQLSNRLLACGATYVSVVLYTEYYYGIKESYGGSGKYCWDYNSQEGIHSEEYNTNSNSTDFNFTSTLNVTHTGHINFNCHLYIYTEGDIALWSYYNNNVAEDGINYMKPTKGTALKSGLYNGWCWIND